MAGIKMVMLVVLGHVRILQDITRILFRFNKIYSIKKCQMVVDKETFGSSTIPLSVTCLERNVVSRQCTFQIVSDCVVYLNCISQQVKTVSIF